MPGAMSDPAATPAATHTGKTFSKQRVPLDGAAFVNCTFDECELVYGGGEAPRMEGCRINGGRWSFADAASRTLAFMHGLYHGLGPGGKALIERTFDDIRRPPRAPGPPQ